MKITEIEKEFDDKFLNDNEKPDRIWQIDEEIKLFYRTAILSILEDFKREVMPEESKWLWLAYNDETGEERILNHKGYLEIEQKEGWKWSGHTIHYGWNACREEVEKKANNYLKKFK